MSWLFGGRQKTPQEMLREHQRVLRRSMREMDRERNALVRQEKQLTIEIKKMARQGQMVCFCNSSGLRDVFNTVCLKNATRIMAKDLVRTRANIQKFHRMKSQLQAVSLRIQTIKSTAAMANAMAGAARVCNFLHFFFHLFTYALL